MDIQIESSEPSQEHVEESFFFEPVQSKFSGDKEMKQTLTKWGLGQTLKIETFRFNQHFQAYDTQRFLKDLFSNPNVRYVLNSIKISSNISSIQYEKLNCNQLSLQIFDEFEKQGIVKSDYIQKCMSEYFEGIQICDKIRECLLMQESESYCIFDEEKRKQFLMKVFQFLVIGGSLNQYEDKLTPYIEWTKKIYKSLVSVRKKPESSEIFIESLVFKINSFNNNQKVHEDSYNPQNFIDVVINPSIRMVHILANEWIKFW